MLEIADVHASRGGAPVLSGVSLGVAAGEIVAVVGRNGMGKSTLMMALMGLTPVTAGSIAFDGREVANRRPYEIARAGIGYVPEGRGVFHDLSVMENLLLAARNGRRGRAAARLVQDRFPLLRERASAPAGSLSGGQQQVLAIARALVPGPRLLVIDEFSDGVQPNLVREIADSLVGLSREGTSVLLVEQNATLALEISDRAYILEKGEIVASGVSAELAGDEDLLTRHLVI